METPKKYKEYLNQGICDEQMLGDVIYSYNKRAKNHKDKSNQYRRYGYDKYDNEGKSREIMGTYYGKKDKRLKLFPDKIQCIHKHTIKIGGEYMIIRMNMKILLIMSIQTIIMIGKKIEKYGL